MHYNLHLRTKIFTELYILTQKMKSWEDSHQFSDREVSEIDQRINFFSHTTQLEKLTVAGVDGTGDYPCLGYGDSFVYFTVAHGTIYCADRISGLKEIGPELEPLFHFTWLAEDENVRLGAYEEAFSTLAGMPVVDLLAKSDYKDIKARESGKSSSVPALVDGLIRPHAFDSGNIAIQLRTSAELGMASRLIRNQSPPDYVLVDGTLSLPMATRKDVSLFFEHLKRFCCVSAMERKVGFFALSKSHGLPSEGLLEEIVRRKADLPERAVAEHWYLRLPVPDSDEWSFVLSKGRLIPPQGAVSYLVRFHRSTPVMRLDMDRYYWLAHVKGKTAAVTMANEQKIFSDLDYASHDQRCYGYPYPIKAGHDRASLTKPERLALRKQIIDMAVRAGMNRALFKDPSLATGHG